MKNLVAKHSVKRKDSKLGIKKGGKVMVYGYCRVSTKGQAKDGNSLEAQEKDILVKYENALIFKEAYTGTTTDRPVFTNIINEIKENDILVVTKLDRLARNTVEGIEIVEEIFKRKASVHVLNVGLLEDTAMGQFFLTTLLAVAQLERTQIIERTQSGKAIAKKNAAERGEKFKEGRPEKFDKLQIENALNLLENYSYSQVVRITGISKSTLIRAKKKQNS